MERVREHLIGVLVALLPSILFSQSPATVPGRSAEHYAGIVTEVELRQHLEVLASDAYQGRDTGKEGQKMAARYIREHFISSGIPPIENAPKGTVVEGYYQPFELIEEISGSISITHKETELLFLKELLYFNESIKEDRSVKELVYLGDGSSIGDVQGAVGKVGLVKEPGTKDPMALMGALRKLGESAKGTGVDVLLVTTDRMEELVEKVGHYVSGSRMRLPVKGEAMEGGGGMQMILVSQDAMDDLLGKKPMRKLTRKKVGSTVMVDFVIRAKASANKVLSENVLGFIEGSDKKDELIVITAHYDHIGVENGEVYNGADDDGSGTVAIMMIAKAFAEAKKAGDGPRRSVLVMPVSGEEKGLLGSRYYSEHPIFPLENTVANLNIDMIGRTDSAHNGANPYVYIIGSDRLSSDLHVINEQANESSTKLVLDYTFNDRKDPNRFYYRSDHYNFARKGVPAIFYFSGVHEDYHQPSDTVDKIQYDLLHQRALLVFHTAWLLANTEERIVVDGDVE